MRASFSSISSLSRIVLVAVLAAGSASCESTPDTTPSAPGIPVTETFTGTLQPSGEAFYAFSMSRPGAVSLTLLSITGTAVPDDALFPVGIGTPVGTFCNAGTDAAVKPSASPQHTSNKELGVYCVKIADTGRLGAPATFVLNITHPK